MAREPSGSYTVIVFQSAVRRHLRFGRFCLPDHSACRTVLKFVARTSGTMKQQN